jgi:polysaccharide pyruvyl transferase WcaK-like protein
MLGLRRCAPKVAFTMFDYGAGERRRTIGVGADAIDVTLVGCYNSRRYWRTSNLSQMLMAARMGLGRVHPMTRRLLALDAILDISGGDSFADIYGPRRFNDVTLPKELATALGVPLILLPQTYGPYSAPEARARASRVVRSARQVWARDERSFEVLRQLLGPDFDASRHRSGVDCAFGLPAQRPADGPDTAKVEQLASGADTLVGLNVSGLLFNKPGDDITRYGFRAPYRPLIERLTQALLEDPGVALMLTPHVAPLRPMVDDDAAACDALYQSLPVDARARTIVLPRHWNAMELKWAIGRAAWFCGTRMHSCIGAISQGVPTTAIAYSDKTLGVFQTAGVGDCVVDPRAEGEDVVLHHILTGYRDRARAGAALARALPGVRERLDDQFRSILQGVGA